MKCTPQNAEADGILQQINGKLTIGKVKASRLPYRFVFNIPSLSISMYPFISAFTIGKISDTHMFILSVCVDVSMVGS